MKPAGQKPCEGSLQSEGHGERRVIIWQSNPTRLTDFVQCFGLRVGIHGFLSVCLCGGGPLFASLPLKFLLTAWRAQLETAKKKDVVGGGALPNMLLFRFRKIARGM